MDTRKADLVIQYALAVAGQGDRGHRELGPIHLLKYVYLADLAFAEAEGGKTFTGAAWRFHHFGPWALEVYQRIEPALMAIGATERRFTSPYTEDGIRWEVRDQDLADRIDPNLPWPVARAVKNTVRELGSDTATLLRSVYNTPPMLKAKPGEVLDFRPPSLPEEIPADTRRVDESPKLKTLSKTTLKRIRARLGARSAKASAEPRLIPPYPPPRYDEVFSEGQRWLDSLGGEEIGQDSGRLSFSEDLWKSDSRGELKLP